MDTRELQSRMVPLQKKLGRVTLKHNHKRETGLLKGAYNKPFPLLGTLAKCNYVWGRIGRFVKL